MNIQQKRELPSCPECGLKAEIKLRQNGTNMGSGELRCPYNHFRVGTAFHAGMKEWARNWLIDEWEKKAPKAKESGDA